MRQPARQLEPARASQEEPARQPGRLFFAALLCSTSPPAETRLTVYRRSQHRSPALVLWKSRLGYVYWDRFSNALRGGGYAFRGPYQSLTSKLASQPFFELLCKGYCTEYRSWVGWLLEDHADLLGEKFDFSEQKIGQSATSKRISRSESIVCREAPARRPPLQSRPSLPTGRLLANRRAVLELPAVARPLPAGRPPDLLSSQIDAS